MNATDCFELRDLIFASRFQTSNERVFRFVAVTPGGVGVADATVHFAYAPPVWERAGHDDAPSSVLSHLSAVVADTPYKNKTLVYQFHHYLGGAWPVPWGITAKDSCDNFPYLVLLEAEDGSVSGVLMRDSHSCSVVPQLVDEYAERHEVADLMRILSVLPKDGAFMQGWYKDCNIEADSIEAAIAMTPETESGQKHVLVYREIEWLDGLWNNPSKPNAHPMELGSVADFHGTRVSAAKKASRSGLDVVLAKQVIPGDYDVLDKALQLMKGDYSHAQDDEKVPGVKSLCDWWNANAPEDMRPAAVFRAYWWDADNQMFIAADPEEPACEAGDMAGIPTFTVFQREGRPTVVLVFYRGRVFNAEGEWGTQTFFANGEKGWQIGDDLEKVDEAYYSVEGLRALSNLNFEG